MPDRKVPPPFNDISDISIKQVEKVVLENGVDLYTLRSGTQEVLKLDIIFEAGKFHENRNGIAFFAGKLLSEGLSGYSSVEIAEAFESYGAHLEINSGLDYLEISLFCLSKHFQQLASLLRKIITEPTFPKHEIEIQKNIRTRNLEVNNEKTSFVASKIFRENLFGGSHPYGRILEKLDINKTTRELIVDFFTTHIANKTFTIFASGNFDDNVIQTIENEFGNIDISSPGSIEFTNFSGKSEAIYLEKENSVQTSLRLGTISIPKSHEDYRGLMVANEILGGYFGSRLMKNIREEKGLTYGIFSGIANLKHASYFVISADVKKENRLEAISEIIKEIDNLRNFPVSEEELKTVCNYMLGQIQSSINTPFALISHFKDLYQNGLSYDYFHTYIQTIRSITPAQIQSLVKKYMTPDKLISVGVG